MKKDAVELKQGDVVGGKTVKDTKYLPDNSRIHVKYTDGSRDVKKEFAKVDVKEEGK